MTTRVKYRVLSSRKAYREGIWPTLEWAIFDREGNYLHGGFRTRSEACAWRAANGAIWKVLTDIVEGFDLGAGDSTTHLAQAPFNRAQMQQILEDNALSPDHVQTMLDVLEYNSTKNVRNLAE